jgi:hypothetical protein
MDGSTHLASGDPRDQAQLACLGDTRKISLGESASRRDGSKESSRGRADAIEFQVAAGPSRHPDCAVACRDPLDRDALAGARKGDRRDDSLLFRLDADDGIVAGVEDPYVSGAGCQSGRPSSGPQTRHDRVRSRVDHADGAGSQDDRLGSGVVPLSGRQSESERGECGARGYGDRPTPPSRPADRAEPDLSGIAQTRNALPRQLERGVLRQNRPLEVLKILARLDAELVHESRASLQVDVERVGLAAAAVEREHELRTESLSKRVQGEKRLEVGDDLGMPPEPEVGFDLRLLGGQS